MGSHGREGSQCVRCVKFLLNEFASHVDYCPVLARIVDIAGQWWIGDFGSSVRIGEAIVSTTPSCHPKGTHLLGSPARWEYDWYMLAVALLHQQDRAFAPDSGLGPGGCWVTFDTAVRLQCKVVAEPSLRTLLIELLECRGPTLKLN